MFVMSSDMKPSDLKSRVVELSGLVARDLGVKTSQVR